MNNKTQTTSVWDVFCDYIEKYAQRHDDFMLVVPDTGFDIGILGKLPKEKIFFAASEADAILNAAGFALNGKKPWITGNCSRLVARCYGQIREALAIPSLNVRIAAADGGLSKGQEGVASLIIEDLALMRAMPNMNIFVPSDIGSVYGIAKASETVDGPVYLRLGMTSILQPRYDPDDLYYAGGARLLREGTGVTICACGIMVSNAIAAAEILEQQGISAEVIDCYSLKPFPEQIVLASVRRTGCCVAAEEHCCIGGLGGALAECLCSTYPVPVRFVGIEDQFVNSGTPEELREYYGLTWKEIVNAAAQVWALRRR
ncbi:MAG: transketolase [Synergistaceae bacterium]|nr:transketolase [Synergistaceae bacterium]